MEILFRDGEIACGHSIGITINADTGEIAVEVSDKVVRFLALEAADPGGAVDQLLESMRIGLLKGAYIYLQGVKKRRQEAMAKN